MNVKCFVALISISTPVYANDITIKLTPKEAATAMALWEIGLKTAGGPAVEAYTVLVNKVRAAQSEMEKSQAAIDKPK